jgi:pyruvate,water dikinase
MEETVLQGIGAAPGAAEGNVSVVLGGVGLDTFTAGNVLVADNINPSMAVAVKTASALVTDGGGKTSHAAIFAREAGIPAVVGAATATQVLKDGMHVKVDGDSGTVTITQ